MFLDVMLHDGIGGHQVIYSKMRHPILQLAGQLAKTTRVSRGERALREKCR